MRCDWRASSDRLADARSGVTATAARSDTEKYMSSIEILPVPGNAGHLDALSIHTRLTCRWVFRGLKFVFLDVPYINVDCRHLTLPDVLSIRLYILQIANVSCFPRFFALYVDRSQVA
jgi:hypothetical protein